VQQQGLEAHFTPEQETQPSLIAARAGTDGLYGAFKVRENRE
jgi:hypothetical protein